MVLQGETSADGSAYLSVLKTIWLLLALILWLILGRVGGSTAGANRCSRGRFFFTALVRRGIQEVWHHLW